MAESAEIFGISFIYIILYRIRYKKVDVRLVQCPFMLSHLFQKRGHLVEQDYFVKHISLGVKQYLHAKNQIFCPLQCPIAHRNTSPLPQQRISLNSLIFFYKWQWKVFIMSQLGVSGDGGGGAKQNNIKKIRSVKV